MKMIETVGVKYGWWCVEIWMYCDDGGAGGAGRRGYGLLQGGVLRGVSGRYDCFFLGVVFLHLRVRIGCLRCLGSSDGEERFFILF